MFSPLTTRNPTLVLAFIGRADQYLMNLEYLFPMVMPLILVFVRGIRCNSVFTFFLVFCVYCSSFAVLKVATKSAKSSDNFCCLTFQCERQVFMFTQQSWHCQKSVLALTYVKSGKRRALNLVQKF